MISRFIYQDHGLKHLSNHENGGQRIAFPIQWPTALAHLQGNLIFRTLTEYDSFPHPTQSRKDKNRITNKKNTFSNLSQLVRSIIEFEE